MSEVGGLADRFSGAQSSCQQQSSWGSYNIFIFGKYEKQPRLNCPVMDELFAGECSYFDPEKNALSTYWLFISR